MFLAYFYLFGFWYALQHSAYNSGSAYAYVYKLAYVFQYLDTAFTKLIINYNIDLSINYLRDNRNLRGS